MHTLDGGVIVWSFRWLFGLLPQRVTKRHVLASTVEIANRCIDAWAKCTPYEFARRPRNLHNIKKWKMIEGRTFLMYLATPMFLSLGNLMKVEFNMLKHLLLAIRLIGGFHLERIAAVCIDEKYRFEGYGCLLWERG